MMIVKAGNGDFARVFADVVTKSSLFSRKVSRLPRSCGLPGGGGAVNRHDKYRT